MKKVGILLLIVTLFLSGCGGAKREKEEGNVDYVAKYQSQKEVDPFQVEWRLGDVESAEVPYKAEAFQSPVLENCEKRSWDEDYMIVNGSYVRLYQDNPAGRGEGSELTFHIDRLDISSDETERFQLHIPRGEAYPAYIDCSGTAIYVMFQKWQENSPVEELWIAPLLDDGKIGEAIDLFHLVQEKDIMQKNESRPESQLPFYGAFHVSEKKECIYLIPWESNTLYVLNMDGTLQCEASQSENCVISFFANTSDGDYIFTVYDHAAEERGFFVYENMALREIFSCQGDLGDNYRKPVSCDPYGNIVYLDNNSNLVNWNISTGKREIIFRDHVAGDKNTLSDTQAVGRTKEGKVVVLRDDADALSKLTYSAGGPAMTVELRIETTDLWWSLPESIRRFEETHPGITVKLGNELINYSSDEADVQRSKLFTSLSKGEGPDMIFLYNTEVQRYADAGALLDMSGVIDEQEYHLVPGLLDIGKYNGKQYYFPTSLREQTVFIQKSIWDKPAWTVEDVLKVLEQQEKESEGNVFLLGRDGTSDGYIAGEYFDASNLMDFFIYDLANSPFLDTKNRKAHFDGELFTRVLECCKKQEEQRKKVNAKLGGGELIEKMKADELLLGYVQCPTFGTFSKIGAELEEDVNYVGYPTEGNSGNLVFGNLGLVVNAKTGHREAIEEFLRFFYSFSYQRTVVAEIPMRMDSYESMIVENPAWGQEGGIYIQNGHSVTPIEGRKKDGKSFKEDYFHFLETYVARDASYDEIKTIVREEASYYFQGEKTAREVQEIIQSRVSLLLKEMR
ncbi:MAG: ABC transporter substrate-binding protein [Acetatifactor sp.]|nr:ABC transporter substrate-binding protein [Acetatifactor sp.]